MQSGRTFPSYIKVAWPGRYQSSSHPQGSNWSLTVVHEDTLHLVLAIKGEEVC